MVGTMVGRPIDRMAAKIRSLSAEEQRPRRRERMTEKKPSTLTASPCMISSPGSISMILLNVCPKSTHLFWGENKYTNKLN